MWLGKQGENIVSVKNTREEVENTPCLEFTEIVETDEPVEMVDNKYYVGEENILEAKKKLAEEIHNRFNNLKVGDKEKSEHHHHHHHHNLSETKEEKETNREYIAHQAYPSSKFDTLTPPPVNTEATYTALADGFVSLSVNIEPNGSYWLLNRTCGFMGIQNFNSSNTIQKYRAYCPVSKGQQIIFNITAGYYDFVKFYYANGFC